MEPKWYTIAQAARMAGLSEDELRCAIKDGMLKATLQQNTGDFLIAELELMDFMQSTKIIRAREIRKRVMIVDDEINFANVLNLELNRDRRIESRFATWGKDCIQILRAYRPDVLLVDFVLPDMQATELLDRVTRVPELKKVSILVYSAHLQGIQQNPEVEQRLKAFGVTELLDKTRGMRPILAKIYERLGLDAPVKPR